MKILIKLAKSVSSKFINWLEAKLEGFFCWVAEGDEQLEQELDDEGVRHITITAVGAVIAVVAIVCFWIFS